MPYLFESIMSEIEHGKRSTQFAQLRRQRHDQILTQVQLPQFHQMRDLTGQGRKSV